MKRYRLTAELQNQIVSSIRSGGYGHVAAAAWGVPRKVFERWLKKGRGTQATEPYKTFAAEVQAARAQARLKAEIDAFNNHARAWLEHGPGKEKPGDPGWSGPVKPDHLAGRDVSPFQQAEFMAMCRMLLDVLAPFPEARACAASALAAMKESAVNKEPSNMNDKPEDNTPWSASEDGTEKMNSLSPQSDDKSGPDAAATTTITSPPAVPAAATG